MKRVKLSWKKPTFGLRECIEDALDVLSFAAGAQRVDLLYLINDNVPDSVKGDAARIQQILLNLVGNAVKFTSSGDVTVTVSRVEKEMAPGGIRLRFSVKDTGLGIPLDKQDKLFNSFSQVDESTTRIYGGTGLGLAICKRLSELMGGRIWVESELGAGAEFFFEIEAQLSQRKSAILFVQGQVPELKNKEVLVVDDNEKNLLIAERYLKRVEMLPTLVNHPHQALKLVAEKKFDLLILDYHMPDMDGVELAQGIRAQLKEAAPPIILLTSLNYKEAVPSGLFDEMIYKPVREQRLVDSMMRLLSGRAESPRKSRKPTSELQGPKIKILLAEDNLANQTVVKLMIKQLGIDIDIVGDGGAAVEKIMTRPYDLVLIDMQMPVMDGVEASLKIRA